MCILRHWGRIGCHVKRISADTTGAARAAGLEKGRDSLPLRGHKTMTTSSDAWQALSDWQPQKLTDLVAADPETRLQALVRSVADIRFDFAKTHLDGAVLAILSGLAEAQDFAGRRKTLFSGGIANPTEDRAAEHSAERGDGAPESVHAAKDRKSPRLNSRNYCATGMPLSAVKK